MPIFVEIFMRKFTWSRHQDYLILNIYAVSALSFMVSSRPFMLDLRNSILLFSLLALFKVCLIILCSFIYHPMLALFSFMLMIWLLWEMIRLKFGMLRRCSNDSLRWNILDLFGASLVLRFPIALMNICCLSRSTPLTWSLMRTYLMML